MKKKGQMVVVDIMILAMAVIVFIALIPAIKSILDTSRGCDSLNCAGYVDTDATAASCGSTNKSYVTTLEEDTLACTIIDLQIPYLVLAVMVGLIAKLLHGRLSSPPAPEPPMYGGYGGY